MQPQNLQIIDNPEDPRSTERVCLDPGFIEQITQGTYPETPAYSINWLGGTSGAALGSIMSYFIWPNRPAFGLSKEGNSHDGLDPGLLNWADDSHRGPGFPGGHVEGFPSRCLYVRPQVAQEPILVYDHTIHDWNRFFARWPRARAVVMSYTGQERCEMEVNFFAKFYMQYYDPQTSSQWWHDLKARRPELFGHHEHPYSITLAEYEEYFKSLVSSVEKADSDIVDYYHSVRGPGTVPPEYKHRVRHQSYYQFTRNPEGTLNELSEFLGLQITEDARQFYRTYLAKQDQVIADYAPWLRDPGPWNSLLT